MQRLMGILRNRYALTAVCFAGYIALFHDHDLWTMFKLRRQLSKIRTEQRWYAGQIEVTRLQLEQLSSDKMLLEKFARERYLMKRENEEIFVLVAD